MVSACVFHLCDRGVGDIVVSACVFQFDSCIIRNRASTLIASSKNAGLFSRIMV